jgi:hypothetical protein
MLGPLRAAVTQQVVWQVVLARYGLYLGDGGALTSALTRDGKAMVCMQKFTDVEVEPYG